MAVEAAIVVIILVAVSIVLWRLFARADGRARRLLAAYGVFVPLLTMAASVLFVANATTTADPLPGLQGLLAGGW
jgi:hypothetical protein